MAAAKKVRLDVLLVERGLAATRSKAQSLILSGAVHVSGMTVVKPGSAVDPEVPVAVTAGSRYVSRGGEKLEAALARFNLDPTGWRVADVGASTGGFTDCWLQHGAAHVFAIDVGYGQLDWRLRNSPQVSVFERVNARYLKGEQLGLCQRLDGASIDVSFIGLGLVLAPIRALIRDAGWIVALVKPQFEAGPRLVGKGGVVKDPEVHAQVLERVIAELPVWGLTAVGLTYSPIKGPKGNIEFLLGMRPGQARGESLSARQVVDEAWMALNDTARHTAKASGVGKEAPGGWQKS